MTRGQRQRGKHKHMKRQALHQRKDEQEAVHRDFCQEKIHECLFQSKNIWRGSAFSSQTVFKRVLNLLYKKVSVRTNVSSALGCPEAAALTTGELGAPPVWQNRKGRG